MVRRIIGALAATTLIVAGANAQSPFQENYQQTSIGSGSPTGFDFGQYAGEFLPSVPENAPSLTKIPTLVGFQVWCVDPLDDISPGSHDYSWVTPMNQSNFGNTIKNNQTAYQQAAYLASFLVGPISVANENLQYAMWELLGYTTVNSGACSGGLIANCPNYNATTVGTNKSNAIANYSSLDFGNWFVITSPLQDGQLQEVIYQAVPEPGTMSLLAMGLVGMAGVGLRRRKKR